MIAFVLAATVAGAALPYTSEFLQLDCGYWSAEAEVDLRRRIDASG